MFKKRKRNLRLSRRRKEFSAAVQLISRRRYQPPLWLGLLLRPACHFSSLPHRQILPSATLLVATQCPSSNKPAVNKKMFKLNGAPQSLQQQLGNINAQMRRSQNVQSTNWVQGPTSLDEFKYGFPSSGLPSLSKKWWGSSCPDETNNEDDKHHFKVVNDGFASLIDLEKSESIEEDLQADLQGTRLLTALRKRSTKRGRKVLKHGNYSHGQSLNKLSKEEQSLLLNIFRSSTPNEWMINS